MSSDWMSKADRFNGDIHFKTKEAFSAEKQKATSFPTSPWAMLPPGTCQPEA